jgi:hypothetical protein
MAKTLLQIKDIMKNKTSKERGALKVDEYLSEHKERKK